MQTTGIPAERTAQEISYLLAQAGATAVLTEYGKDKKISGLGFRLRVRETEVPFLLPVRVNPVFKALQAERSPKNREKKAEEDALQAEKVAWRQLLRWIQAQLAMIDTGMVASDEVFMPYVQTSTGQTLYEKLITSGKYLQLSSGDHKS